MVEIIFIVISILLAVFNLGLIIFVYYTLRNKQGPVGPRGLQGPIGPTKVISSSVSSSMSDDNTSSASLKKCKGTVKSGYYKDNTCDYAYNQLISEKGETYADYWCEGSWNSGCTLMTEEQDTDNPIPSSDFFSTSYKKYPNVLDFGTSLQLSSISGSDKNGCINNLSLDDAEEKCNGSLLCDGFYIYDITKPSRVCFKSSVDTNQQQKTSASPNSAFYTKIIQDKPSGDAEEYNQYPKTLDFGTSPKFSISGGDANGCLNNTSLNDAKDKCNTASGCDGFFIYDTTKPSRVCFKSNIDTSQAKKNSTVSTSAFFEKKK